MKIRTSSIIRNTGPISEGAQALLPGIETSQPKNVGLRVLKLCVGLFCSLAASTVFGQATINWTGAVNDGTNLAVAVNWGGTLPSTANSDTAQWSGTVAGPLNLVYNNNAWQSGFGQSGVNLYLTGTQTSPVNISTTPGSGRGPIAFYNITIDSGGGRSRLAGRVRRM